MSQTRKSMAARRKAKIATAKAMTIAKGKKWVEPEDLPAIPDGTNATIADFQFAPEGAHDTDPDHPSRLLWDLSGPTGILKANRTFARAMTAIASKDWVPEADRNQIARIVNQWERSEEAFEASTDVWRRV